MRRNFLILFGLLCLTVVANPGAAIADDMLKLVGSYSRPDSIPFPKSNLFSEAKSELGKTLYFDPRLSKSGTQSCATCHNPSFSWEDGMPKGVGHGHKELGRATPTILNLAWDDLYFWDGRANSLEEQALGPIESGAEMAMDLQQMVANLKSIKGYKELFEAAFPKISNEDLITKENVAKAIATFERTVISGIAPFDKWVAGDQTAISASAKRGFEVFNDKGNCSACHSGWRFSDGSFHDIGLNDEDMGRGTILKQVEPMQHAFKTVGLRNIDQRGAYMHNGSYSTLEEVVDHYDSGFERRASLSDDVRKLGLSDQEKLDLVNFLKSLTSKDEPVTIPVLPR